MIVSLWKKSGIENFTLCFGRSSFFQLPPMTIPHVEDDKTDGHRYTGTGYYAHADEEGQRYRP